MECKRLGDASLFASPPCNINLGPFSPKVHEGTAGLRQGPFAGNRQLPAVEDGNGYEVS
jgi:hypothetical protein